MTKLSDDDKALLRLIQRSTDRGEGWRHVSKALWGFVSERAANLGELVEFEALEDGIGRIRLTEKGQTVLQYM